VQVNFERPLNASPCAASVSLPCHELLADRRPSASAASCCMLHYIKKCSVGVALRSAMISLICEQGRGSNLDAGAALQLAIMLAAADTAGGEQRRAAVDLLQTALGANGTVAAEVLISVAHAVGERSTLAYRL